MSMQFRDIAAQAAADGAISADEILALRQGGWSDGTITLDEADAIFRINDNISDATPEWSDFFVEALGEFIINGVEPKGYVDEAQADWLIARIDHDGRLEGMAELELLVRLFERAQSAPEKLHAYALAQIERAVLTGEGPTRGGGTLAKGTITAAEATLLRRIIFSSGSERPAAVSYSEAELLFRIKDAALGADNAPEWRQLFVQGVGNYLTGFAGHSPLSSARAAELEAFMNDSRVSLGRFVRRAAGSDFGDSFKALLFGRKNAERDLAGEVSAAQAVDDQEKLWLDAKLNADDRIDDYEQALLEFIAEESGEAR